MSIGGTSARGFNTTVGVGTTDLLAAPSRGTSAKQTWAIFFLYRSGSGGRRVFDCDDAANNIRTLGRLAGDGIYSFTHAWTGSVANWNLDVTPSNDVWHQLVVMYDDSSTNPPVIYVDRRLQTVTQTVAPVGSTQTPTNNVSLGNEQGAGGIRCWNGLLARFILDDGVFWNQAQIDYHYWTGGNGAGAKLWLPMTTSSLTNLGTAGGSFTATGTAMNQLNLQFLPTQITGPFPTSRPTFR